MVIIYMDEVVSMYSINGRLGSETYSRRFSGGGGSATLGEHSVEVFIISIKSGTLLGKIFLGGVANFLRGDPPPKKGLQEALLLTRMPLICLIW